jgi:hypothetical protein
LTPEMAGSALGEVRMTAAGFEVRRSTTHTLKVCPAKICPDLMETRCDGTKC